MKDLLRPGPEALVCAVAAVLLSWNIHSGSLLPSDDCLYAGAAREMARTQDFLSPSWQGQPLFEKGPILFWMLVASRALFGDGEAAVRLPGVLSALAVWVLAWRLGLALGLSRGAALAGAALLLSSNVFFFNARRPMTDMPALAFGLGGLVAWVTTRRAAACGTLLGLSALTKITGPLPFLAALGALEVNARHRVRLRDAAVMGGALAVVLVPWHVGMLLAHGPDFLDIYFGYHLFERVTRSLVGEVEEPTYLAWLLEREGPLALCLGVAVCVTVVRAVRRDRVAFTAAGLWIGAGLPLLLSSTALPHYLVALLPAATVSCGLLVHEVARGAGRVGPLAPPAFFMVAVVSFAANNGLDLVNPDYGPGTKAICARLNAQGESVRLVGTLDLHDPCVSWYCEANTTFYALDPGYIRAVRDIPALRGVIHLVEARTMRELARFRSLLFVRPDRIAKIRGFANASGVDILPIAEAPSRILVEVRPSGEPY